MALGYDRLVTYDQTYYPNLFLRDIKKEPGTFDFQRKPSESSCLYESMDTKRFLAKGKSMPSECELTSWVNKHPKHWTKTEVLDWIFTVVETNHLDGSRVQGEAYREFTGETLFRMSKSDFENVDPSYGTKMYETFRSLINNISFEKPPSEQDVNQLEDFNSQYCDSSYRLNIGILERVHPNSSSTHCHSHHNRQQDPNGSNLTVFVKEDEMKVDIPDLGVYSIDTDIYLPPYASKIANITSFLAPHHNYTPLMSSASAHCSQSSHYTSLSSSMPNFQLTCEGDMDSGYHHQQHMPSSSRLPVSVQQHMPSSSRLPVSVQQPPSRPPSSSSSLVSSPRRMEDRDPGYSSDESTGTGIMVHLDSSSSLEDIDMNQSFCGRQIYRQVTQPSGSKQINGKKTRSHATKNGNHLWEFVRDLLRDPTTNPKLLKWEDKENGVFRFVQSEAVAHLWGEKKNNPQMTYEKLSRAMRFCRTAGYFESVPKNGKFPKKLCFMFGNRAHGWKD